MNRICLVVLDGVGVGYLPDAELYGDVGAMTIKHVLEKHKTKLPNMEKMGLGFIENTGATKNPDAIGAYGRAMEKSSGKDTTTGHWEMMGLELPKAFPTYPDGFPQDIIKSFECLIGTEIIGNYSSSGTTILEKLGREHIETKKPIVYTSADSVFQIACHEDVYPIEKLYEMCLAARNLLKGDHAVGRVIARPFVGAPGCFTRTDNRRDFSLEPIGTTLLDVLSSKGYDTLAVGKIEDIFCMRGITKSNHAAGNSKCIDAIISFLKQDFSGLLFANLVDFDMHFGHRNDSLGFSGALEYFDRRLPEIIDNMEKDDMLIITADHGCDPTFAGTDHTREYIPILVWSKQMRKRIDLGTRSSFADIAATIADGFECDERFNATSFYELIG